MDDAKMPLPDSVKTAEAVFVREEEGGRYLIINRAGSGVFVGSNTTALIIELARPGISTTGLQDALCDRYPSIDPGVIDADVKEAVQALYALGVLEADE